jgi:hypothetical protein
LLILTLAETETIWTDQAALATDIPSFSVSEHWSTSDTTDPDNLEPNITTSEEETPGTVTNTRVTYENGYGDFCFG